MSDEFSIQQTLSTYCLAASSRDWDLILTVFTPDAVWEVPSLGAKFHGHQAIREGFIALTSTTQYIVQVNAPALIQVDGDTATARALMRECGRHMDRDEVFEIHGIYTDRLARTAEGWKFTHRKLAVLARHSYPVLPAES